MNHSHDRLTLSYYTFPFSIDPRGKLETYRGLADPRWRKALLLPVREFASECRDMLQIGYMSE